MYIQGYRIVMIVIARGASGIQLLQYAEPPAGDEGGTRGYLKCVYEALIPISKSQEMNIQYGNDGAICRNFHYPYVCVGDWRSGNPQEDEPGKVSVFDFDTTKVCVLPLLLSFSFNAYINLLFFFLSFKSLHTPAAL